MRELLKNGKTFFKKNYRSIKGHYIPTSLFDYLFRYLKEAKKQVEIDKNNIVKSWPKSSSSEESRI